MQIPREVPRHEETCSFVSCPAGHARAAGAASLKRRDYTPQAKGALDGIRVLDLSRLFAGNLLTQILGDFGAEVIKVEPPAGDTLRAWQTAGVATHWKIFARNKKSLCLELRKPEGEPYRVY